MQEVGVSTCPIASSYLLLSKIFSYPTQTLCEFLRDGELAGEVGALNSALPFRVPLEVMTRLGQPLPELEAVYVGLFDVGFGPSVACSLYEGMYRKDTPRRRIFEDLLRFYDYFGARLSETYRDYPDHLCAELEFMAHLNSRERGEGAASYRLAQRDFLERHLATWTEPLRARVFQHVQIPLYRAASVCLVTLVDEHRKHLAAAVAEQPGLRQTGKGESCEA